MLKNLFSKKKLTEEQQEKLEEKWYDTKTELMERVLGKEHDMVMHAIIPYEIGGTLDLYYFPNGVSGTGIATKELSYACKEGSKNDKYQKYELAMFTRHKLDLDKANDNSSEFGKAHNNISCILNSIARYSEEAILNPYDTCEFPSDFEDIGGKCLVFVDYTWETEDEFGVMAIIEVFKQELDYAIEHGSYNLLKILNEHGHYPYSDLDREPVV